MWLLLVVGLGAFAPKVEANLSGAGWQADGSESVAVRELATEHFGGNASSAIQVVVHRTDGPVTEGRGKQVLDEVTAALEADPRIADVIAPQPGATLSQDGSTAVVLAGAGADTNEMVRVADDLKGPLQALSGDGVEVNPTGASLLWSDFNEANLDAMLKSEMFSWPVTLAILVLAFGALVAAGLPLHADPRRAGRLGRLAGADQRARAGLDLGDELRDDVRPRARHRLRAVPGRALPRRPDGAPRDRRARPSPRPWTPPARPCCSPGLTVLVSLSAVMLVPSPSFRSMAGGIMLSVVFVLAATLTLLPAGAVQARPPDQQARPAVGPHR